MKYITRILTFAIPIMFTSPMLLAQNEPPTEKPMAQQMEKMHSQLQSMQQQMKEIKATKDPEKRKALMQKNMQSFRESMMMMGEMDEAQSKMAHPSMQEKKARMACQQDDAQCQRMHTMEHRQEGMQERMSMMQMMMQQMMEHQSALAEQQ
jgi:protein CpxP